MAESSAGVVGSSRNDVRGELILDRRYLILQEQLLLLQTLDRELIGIDRQLERNDLIIEQAMLVAELDQQLSKFTVVSSLHARSAKPKAFDPREPLGTMTLQTVFCNSVRVAGRRDFGCRGSSQRCGRPGLSR
jgi:hypothetical protein